MELEKSPMESDVEAKLKHTSIKSSPSLSIVSSGSDSELEGARTMLPDIICSSSHCTNAVLGDYQNPDLSTTSETNLIEDRVDVTSCQLSMLHITLKIWVWILTMLFTYIVCLSVFPSITALVESKYYGQVNQLP